MRLLFLNVWHGKLKDELRNFLQTQSDVEVFCFQEAEYAEAALPEFLGQYQKFSATKKVAEKVNYTQAIYVHSRYRVSGIVEIMQDDREVGLALALTVTAPDGKSYTILNAHGVSRAYRDGQFLVNDNKQDFPARIRQSEAMLNFVEASQYPVIFGGDLNVLPETENLEMFRRAGYRDLIRDYQITTTRNHFSWDRYPASERYVYSDYLFITPSIVTKDFSVPNVEVSDHLPMIVEFE